MIRRTRWALAMAATLLAGQATEARAQWGFPGGFGGFCWGGWGVGTAEGDIARGMGQLAMGMGFYEEQTAVARSIDTDTVMRWNNYVYESQKQADKVRRERQIASRERTARLAGEIQDRLRNRPDARDIQSGDALNVALDEIDDPRVYTTALRGANAVVGGDKIRQIPFRYASAAITYSIHDLAKGKIPASLQRPEFAADREAFKALDEKIMNEIAEGKDPDTDSIDKMLAVIYAAEERVAQVFPRNSRERNEAERYLKGMHGLASMLKTPAINVILSGVENRPSATLGELLKFMSAFNLRFGVADTPAQREVYMSLYPQLVQVRDQIAPALASTAPASVNGTEAADFFSVMSDKDLQKKSPKPPAPGVQPQP